MAYNVAIAGVTGNVGMTMVRMLEERKFPINQLFCLASDKSVGKKIGFLGQELPVENLDTFDFRQVQIVLSSAGSEVSKRFAQRAAEAGAIVIDNTSCFRFDDDIPLVVPEVNPDQIEKYHNRGIISNPNCNVIPITVVLKPLHDDNPIKRLVISTYQSVSGAGKEAMDELYEQTKGRFENNMKEPKVFSHPIAFNILPQIGEILEDGFTEEEYKTEREIQKIMKSPLEVTATCVRVPTFIGHSASINVEFENEVEEDHVFELLREALGVALLDSRELGRYITPLETVGDELVYVSRVRRDKFRNNCLNLWVSSDNLRKGAALNAIQIAEELIKYHI